MPTATTDKPPTLDQRLDRFELWMLGHRHIMAPPATAAAMWCTSALAHGLTGVVDLPLLAPVDLGWWPFGLYVVLVAAAVGLVGVDVVHHIERVPLLGDDKPGERADESLVNARGVSAFGWGFGAVWCVVHAWAGPSLEALGILGVFLVPAWVGWFHSRRVQRGVEVFAQRAKWDGDAVGAPGLEAATSDARAALDGSWWEWPLKSTPKGRWTAPKIRRVLANIAARYEVSPDELTVDEPRPGRFVLRYEKADPNEAPLTYQPPAPSYSIRHRARVGRWDDDGSPMLVPLYVDDHGAVDGIAIGQKGGGKSNYEEVSAAHVVVAGDALLWLGDCKPGAQQWGPWAPACDWIATSPGEIDDMMASFLRLFEVRGQSGGRIVKPSKKRPAVIFIGDEGALYFNPALPPGDYTAKQALQARIALSENVLAVCRSFAVGIRWALQRAVWDNIGGATIRNHLVGGESAIFRTAKNADARLAVDIDEDEAERMKTSSIPRSRPGTGYIANAEQDKPRKGRVFRFTEQDRDALIAQYAGKQPTLEPEAVEALGEVYANRRRTVPGQVVAIPDGAGDDDLGDPVAVPEGTTAPRLTLEESLTSVWVAAGQFEPHGGTAKEVAAKAGRTESMTRARLTQLVELGVMRTEGGKRARRYLPLGDEDAVRRALEDANNDADGHQ